MLNSMTIRDFLLSVAFVTLFSWIAWITVLFYIDPELSPYLGVFMFYAALFFSLLGSFTLIGLGVRVLFRRLHKEKIIAFKFVSPSLRQAIWFTILIIVSLILLTSNLFTWWSIGLLMTGLVILEIFYNLRTSQGTPMKSTAVKRSTASH